MLDILLLIGAVVAATFIVPHVLGIVFLPVSLLSLTLFDPVDDPTISYPRLFRPLMVFNNLYYGLVMVGWAALCAHVISSYVAEGRAGSPWFVYLLGCVGCLNPLIRIDTKYQDTGFAMNLAITVAFISYIVFAICPEIIPFADW